MAGVDYRRLGRADLPHVLAMFGRCSRTTLVRRFHGPSDGTSYARQLFTESDQMTLGAWADGRCIGIATLAPNGDRYDLGVVIEDDWQRHGVGTALVLRLVRWARARGIHELGADVLAESGFVLPALGRIGGVETTLTWGVYCVRIALRDDAGRRRPEEGLP